MLETLALAEWFTDAGLSVPVSYDTLQEGPPHDVVVLSISGGLGFSTERAFDRVTFSVLIRASGGGVAEAIGNELDQLWINTPNGFYVGDAWVVDKGRFSGPPAFVGDDQSEVYNKNPRKLRSATYYVEIEY